MEIKQLVGNTVSITYRTQKNLMMKIKIISILVIAFLMISCEDDEKTKIVKPVEFTTLSQGDLKGNGEEGIVKSKLIVSDNTSFGVLLSKINAVNDEISPAPAIDFNESVVLAVFDDIKSHGGYSIDITKVSEHEDRLVVEIERLNEGGMLTVITQPYHIVKIPKSTKPIIFKEK